MADHIETPTTVKEIGIHLIYISKKLEELENTLKSQQAIYATKETVADIETRVTILEERNTLKNTLLWVGLVASAIINIVVIYQLFTGG
jgi:hypothetical protein